VCKIFGGWGSGVHVRLNVLNLIFEPPVEKITLQELVARVERGENVEVVDYEGNLVVVDKVKGVVKGDFSQEDLSELKKPTKEQLALAAEIAKLLAEARQRFKIVYGPKEVTIRVGSGFIRVTEDDVRLAGYSGLEEAPLPLIIDTLRKYGEVKLLKPLK